MIPAYDHLLEMRQRVEPVELDLELCRAAFTGHATGVQENIAIKYSRRGIIVRIGHEDQRNRTSAESTRPAGVELSFAYFTVY